MAIKASCHKFQSILCVQIWSTVHTLTGLLNQTGAICNYNFCFVSNINGVCSRCILNSLWRKSHPLLLFFFFLAKWWPIIWNVMCATSLILSSAGAESYCGATYFIIFLEILWVMIWVEQLQLSQPACQAYLFKSSSLSAGSHLVVVHASKGNEIFGSCWLVTLFQVLDQSSFSMFWRE